MEIDQEEKAEKTVGVNEDEENEKPTTAGLEEVDVINEEDDPEKQGREKIKRRKREKISSPNFFNLTYCVKPAATVDTPTFTVKSFYNCYQNKSDETNITLCLIHGPRKSTLQELNFCNHCTPFVEFPYSFVVKTRHNFFQFPQPNLYVGKNFNYFRSFIETAHNNLFAKSEAQIKNGSLLEDRYYAKFIRDDFKFGNLQNLTSGKNSYIRKKLLGYLMFGVRLTVTIDCTLGPNYASIPQKIYNELNLATNYVILNRAPSINSRCIYVCELLCHSHVNDMTIRINPYIVPGLNCDQDGDEISCFVLQRKAEVLSLEMEAAIIELRSLSWKYGSRHDSLYRPRYSFSQYHKYILHTYNEYFCQHNSLWASLSHAGDTPKKCSKLMDLGCSLLHTEVDEFIEFTIEFTKALPLSLVSCKEFLCRGRNSILDRVVDSGAKGCEKHIEIFLKNLHTRQADLEKGLITGFDNYVNANQEMSLGGTRQFVLLYGLNSVYIHNNNVYSNNQIILKDLESSDLASHMFYNPTSVEYVFDQLLADERV